MKSPIITAFVALAPMLFCSCGADSGYANRKSEYLLTDGTWSCHINDSGFQGFETLTFSQNGQFGEREKLRLSATDSGFSFGIDIDVRITGQWLLSNDSLSVKYCLDSLVTDCPIESFYIKTANDLTEQTDLSAIKDAMYNDLDSALKIYFTAKYKPLSLRYIFLGRIICIANDTIKLENSGNYLTLHR